MPNYKIGDRVEKNIVYPISKVVLLEKDTIVKRIDLPYIEDIRTIAKYLKRGDRL